VQLTQTENIMKSALLGENGLRKRKKSADFPNPADRKDNFTLSATNLEWQIHLGLDNYRWRKSRMVGISRG
jgi:hypothetical protein